MDKVETSTIWDVFFDLYLDGPAFDLIKRQCGKLDRLFETLATWQSSSYGGVIRIANTETFNLLRQYWNKYSSSYNSSSQFKDKYRQRVEQTYEILVKEETHLPHLCPVGTVKYWKYGALEENHGYPHCNPLFFYSDGASSRFQLHKDTNPLSAFHLDGNDSFAEQITLAKSQFNNWCSAFNIAVKATPERIRIRFLIADDISCCMALMEHLDTKDPGREEANFYSRLYSHRGIKLDGNDFTSSARKRAPQKFNVIHSGRLVESIGLLNVIPRIGSLLESTTSVLYTTLPAAPEALQNTALLEHLLCGDLSVMCHLIGLAPTSFLCGVSSRAPYNHRPLTKPLPTLVTWRMGRSGDAIMDIYATLPTVSIEQMGKFFQRMYMKMFAIDPDEHNIVSLNKSLYTPASFAFLLSQIKRRMTVNFNDVVDEFLTQMYENKERLKSREEPNMQELIMQFQLHHIYTDAPPPPEATNLTFPVGVLKRRNSPLVSALVLAIPHSRWSPLFSKLSILSDPPPITFQMIAVVKGCMNCLSAVQPIFGKVKTADGETGTIEIDPLGWQGTSDLILCSHFPNALIRIFGDRDPGLGAILAPDKRLTEIFSGKLGSCQEKNIEGYGRVFIVEQTCLRHTENLYFFRSLPSLKAPKLGLGAGEVPIISRRLGTNDISIGFPHMDVDEATFTTTLTIKNKTHEYLKSGVSMEVRQFSTCTLSIRFGEQKIQINFAFPVNCDKMRVQLSRSKGWIKVVAPFITGSNRGFLMKRPFQLCRGQDLKIYSFYLPYVNPQKLLPFDNCTPIDVTQHLNLMFTESESTDNVAKDALAFVRRAIKILLSPTPRVLRIHSENGGHPTFTFFVAKRYFDQNAQAVVADTYVSQGLFPAPADAIAMAVPVEALALWRDALPAMRERIRISWEHDLKVCENYQPDIVPPADQFNDSFCSCGKGIVEQDFRNFAEWKPYEKYVTRVLISPLFPVQYLSSTASTAPKATTTPINPLPPTQTTQYGSTSISPSTEEEPSKCVVCNKEARKRCAKCTVRYCSRECQAQDWKKHKRVCTGKGG